MPTTLRLAFPHDKTAAAVRLDHSDDLDAALKQIGLAPARRVLVLVGGAGKLAEADFQRLKPFFEDVLVPLATDEDMMVIDGGTDAGTMRLMGQARYRARASFNLIGVAAIGTVVLPHMRPSSPNVATLESNHSHFVLVPGNSWGAEAPWLVRVASALARDVPSATVLVNGGEIAWHDAQASVDAYRPLLVVAGSGRTADVVVRVQRGEADDPRAAALLASGLVQVLDPAVGPSAMRQVLNRVLGLAPVADQA